MKLQDKVVVVTGSTRGIGRAVAEACAREGARVVVSSRNETAVQEVCGAMAARGLQISGIAADVSVKGDLERLLQHALDRWGRVDVWINNAGVSGGFRPLDEMSPEEIKAIVDTNLTATLQACRLLIPYFNRQGGILVNMSGKGGRGDPSPHLTTYAATKAAVISLTKSLALENKGHPISIHAVLPGMVATDFYKDVDASPKLTETARSIPYVLKAVGMPIDLVAQLFVDIAAQQPGKETGKIYSLFKGRRLARGIGLLMWYRATGKIKSA